MNNENAQSTRFYGFDLLRGISAFLIIGCHLGIKTTPSCTLLFRYNQCAVEVFGAISGFLLSQSICSSKPLLNILSGRIKRLLPLLIGWTLVYIILLSILDMAFGVPSNYIQKILSPRALLSAFFRGSAEIHLWFLASLLYLSIAVTVADRIVPTFFKHGLAYLVLSAIILGVSAFIPRSHVMFLQNRHIQHFANYDLRLLAFMFIGIGIHRLYILRIFNRLHYFLLSSLIVVTIFYWFAYEHIHRYILDFVLVSLTLIVFSDRCFHYSRITAFLSSTSLCVYLIHPLFSRILSIFSKCLIKDAANIAQTITIWGGIYSLSVLFSIVYNRKLR